MSPPGRPPGPTGKDRDKALNIRVGRAELESWREVAKAKDMTLSELVRWLLNEAVAKLKRQTPISTLKKVKNMLLFYIL